MEPFYVCDFFTQNLLVPVNRSKGSTKTHIFAAEITNFIKIYVFCDKFSNNLCVSQRHKEFWDHSSVRFANVTQQKHGSGILWEC